MQRTRSGHLSRPNLNPTAGVKHSSRQAAAWETSASHAFTRHGHQPGETRPRVVNDIVLRLKDEMICMATGHLLRGHDVFSRIDSQAIHPLQRGAVLTRI